MKRKEQIREEVDLMFEQLRRQLPGLCRIAVALYEEDSDILHSFLKSPAQSKVFTHYSEFLSKVPSLKALADDGEPRIISELVEPDCAESHSYHRQELSSVGIKSSYTVPMYLGESFLGFVFFDADQTDYFSEDVIAQLSIYTRLIEALLVMDILPVKTLMGMVSSTKRITGFKDDETGKHIGRVSSYVELIATELSKVLNLSDEFIEYVWLYAPLHDIGKIGVADAVLLKPESLNPEEYEQMKLHVNLGFEMIEQIIEDFDFGSLHHISILRNVIACHHERWDGKGYPKGLKGEEIPLEGRIMAVGDVFDALSSSRVYRNAFTLEDTFEYIVAQRGRKFDPQCVDAFINQKERVIAIYKKFKERGL
ncbi:HD-GYP domain-containing protein [Thiomicrorhabdus sp. Milos-T2]|uniref:HD-GYP domain-containing protein n=1 Tax=Thiomicrorhabdus sp. Milos-T2 TaxID=90814 RepID=UPI001319F15A|nr:HD domain-containing phosphohydrolase [Thiomicrorhabdus sp. Milos-T2]